MSRHGTRQRHEQLTSKEEESWDAENVVLHTVRLLHALSEALLQ